MKTRIVSSKEIATDPTMRLDAKHYLKPEPKTRDEAVKAAFNATGATLHIDDAMDALQRAINLLIESDPEMAARLCRLMKQAQAANAKLIRCSARLLTRKEPE